MTRQSRGLAGFARDPVVVFVQAGPVSGVAFGDVPTARGVGLSTILVVDGIGSGRRRGGPIGRMAGLGVEGPVLDQRPQDDNDADDDDRDQHCGNNVGEFAASCLTES